MGPQSATTDAGTAVSQPLMSLIAMDRYLKAAYAVNLRGRGLRFTRMVCPPQTRVPGLANYGYLGFGQW
jgi:hypothetical protein